MAAKKPSPRRLTILFNKWNQAYLRWLLAVAREGRRAVGDPPPGFDQLTPLQSERLADLVSRTIEGGVGKPDLPTVRQIREQMAGVAARAATIEHRALIRAGMPRDYLAGPQQVLLDPSAEGVLGAKVVRGIDVAAAGLAAPVLEQWAQVGADLIQTMEQRLVQWLVPKVRETVVTGQRHEALAETLREGAGQAKRHAQLIARDQVAKLNAQITQNMQERAGITQYTWRTVQDSRVRSRHEGAEGQVYRWDRPEVVGVMGDLVHPGQDVQCRCTAEPVVPKSWSR